jgi:nitroreductase
MDDIGLERGLRERRAIRHYSDAPVDDALLAEIFELASWAPSPGNTQAWKVIVLGHDASKDVIARFELAGWESVFPVLEQVLRNGGGEPSKVDERRPATADEWRRYVTGMYRRFFEVKGAPRLVLVYRTADRRRYVDLVRLSLTALLRRAAREPSLLQGLRCFFASLRNVPVLVRVNALTRTFGLANFTYALTLAAQSRGLSTCIQSNYLNVQRDLRHYLGLGAEIDIVASILIGYKADDALPAPEMFRTRKPVAVDWIETTPGVVAARRDERVFEAAQ